MNLNYRKAVLEDFSGIKEIMLEALSESPLAFSVSRSEFEMNSTDWWESYINPFLYGWSQMMILALEENKIVGTIGVVYNFSLRKKHTCSLVWFYVKKEYRKNKVGLALYETLTSELKKNALIKKITLFVNEPQLTAINFYKKNGFEISGKFLKELSVESNYYDVLIMEKWL